jgi:DNA gyrase subunit B
MRELMRQGCVYIAQPPLYRVLQKNRRNQKPRYVQTHEEMMFELLDLGLHGAELTLHHRPDDPSRNGAPARIFDATQLKRLAEIMTQVDEPLATLEHRGINLAQFSKAHARNGELPRFRAAAGLVEKWFFSKEEREAHESETRPAQTAEEAAAGPVVESHAAELHEVRSINKAVASLRSEFQLDLMDLTVPPNVNAEPVYPYILRTENGERKLQTIREIVPSLRDLGGRGLNYTRFKGLGEMNPDELYETAMDPNQRVLKRVTLEDAASAEEIFRVLMGDHVEPRREFIEKHALEVRDLDV